MLSVPKIDLHRHLEGSVTPETLIYIARTYGGKLPAHDLGTLRTLVQMNNECPGFKTFLNKFAIFRGFYTCREAIECAVCRAVEAAAADNVQYLELRYSPTHFSSLGRFNECDVVAWVHGAMQRSARTCGIIVVPILTISRDYGLETAATTVEMALSLHDTFFFALDIAGDEMSNPAEPFRGLFEKCRARGLGLTLHAGEAGGARNVREAVTRFGARRIGHGIAAAEDSALMRLLRDRDVLLEVCLTSNLHTGVVPSIAAHPVRTLMGHGVAISLNTDDPAISAISLSDEYLLAYTQLGFTMAMLNNVNRAALGHVFHPDPGWLKKKIGHYWK